MYVTRKAQFIVGTLMLLLTITPLYAAPTTVTMMQLQRAEEAEWQQAVVALFNEQHSDIQVELVAVPDLRPYEKAIAMWAAGIPPHISYGDPHHTIGWGQDGLALNLSELFARDQA